MGEGISILAFVAMRQAKGDDTETNFRGPAVVLVHKWRLLDAKQKEPDLRAAQRMGNRQHVEFLEQLEAIQATVHGLSQIAAPARGADPGLKEGDRGEGSWVWGGGINLPSPKKPKLVGGLRGW